MTRTKRCINAMGGMRYQLVKTNKYAMSMKIVSKDLVLGQLKEWKHLPSLSTQKYSKNKIIWLYVISGGLVLGTALVGLLMSSVSFPIPTIVHIILDKTLNIGWLDDVPKNEELIIW